MEALNSAGAAMAVPGRVEPRLHDWRGSRTAADRRKADLLRDHLAGGGTINAFARIHRMTTAAVGALRATLPASAPVTITGGKPKGSITAVTLQRMDALAERVAEQLDRDVTAAGTALGWPQQTTSRIWRLIRSELGPQAA